MSVSRYPLQWPAGWPRSNGRKVGIFKVSFDKAIQELGWEIERLGGRYPVVSSNVELRIDGQMRRDKNPSDPGIAVYFEIKGKQKVFACDTFRDVKDNIRAIGLTIEAIRAMDRYGATAMLERTLQAFEALPAPKSWADILQVRPDASRAVIEANYKRLAIERHPDRGGTDAAMAELNRARDEALKGAAA